MKIKKPVKVQAPAAPVQAGGATIADRFKLDAVTADTGKTVNKTATMVALIFAIIALGVSGILTFTLYQHWDFITTFLA